MTRSKTASQPVRKLTKSGGHSYYVTIPLDYIRALGWREGQNITVRQSGAHIILEDWEE